MAWNPNIPTVTNRVQDDLDAIRENFQHLDPLAQTVGELQTVSELASSANDLQAVSELASVVEELQAVSGLAPITDDLQTVSGLAPVAGELQAVGELAPYVQALLDSRIVEMGSNSNGEYVRWENGLQVCYHRMNNLGPINTTYGSLYSSVTYSWTFPAVFLSAPVVSIAGDCARNEMSVIGVSGGTVSTTRASSLWLVRAIADNGTDFSAMLFAVGRWK